MSVKLSAIVALGKAGFSWLVKTTFLRNKREIRILRQIISKLDELSTTKSRPFRRNAIEFAYVNRSLMNCKVCDLWLANAQAYNDENPMNWYGERSEDRKVLEEVNAKAVERLIELGG
jgi:hypothetical protein